MELVRRQWKESSIQDTELVFRTIWKRRTAEPTAVGKDADKEWVQKGNGRNYYARKFNTILEQFKEQAHSTIREV